MKFKTIPKTNINNFSGYISSPDKFYRFVEDFNIISVCWSQPTNISASYFLRVLQEGSSAKARGYGKWNGNENDEASNEMNKFYASLLDHGALWKLSNESVICTAMPYGDKESIINSFNKMIQTFRYPETMNLQFLDNKYRFRSNGDYMIAIYCEVTQETFNIPCSDEKLSIKAIQLSAPGILRDQTTTKSYFRDSYVSKYAKRRADGICQLCNKPAPFIDNDGNPFLETHHIIWLADGGADSTENTIALCPNCHRKMHVINLEEDVKKLKKIAEM